MRAPAVPRAGATGAADSAAVQGLAAGSEEGQAVVDAGRGRLFRAEIDQRPCGDVRAGRGGIAPAVRARVYAGKTRWQVARARRPCSGSRPDRQSAAELPREDRRVISPMRNAEIA